MLPADKVRLEGEAVSYEDRVVLENVKFANSFLHTSPQAKTSPAQAFAMLHPSVDARLEVNASSLGSRYAVRAFEPYSDERWADFMRSGVAGLESERDVRATEELHGLDTVTPEHMGWPSVCFVGCAARLCSPVVVDANMLTGGCGCQQ